MKRGTKYIGKLWVETQNAGTVNATDMYHVSVALRQDPEMEITRHSAPSLGEAVWQASQNHHNIEIERERTHPVYLICEQALAAQEDALVALRAGQGGPPWATPESYALAIEDCERRIASIKARLRDPEKMREWWDALPECERAAMLNA